MTCAGSRRKVSAVLYHYPCPDGAFAALAAHLYFSAAAHPVRFFPNTVYEPIRSDGLPFDEIKDVYLLDFVGPPCFVADIAPKVQRFANIISDSQWPTVYHLCCIICVLV